MVGGVPGEGRGGGVVLVVAVREIVGRRALVRVTGEGGRGRGGVEEGHNVFPTERGRRAGKEVR